MIHLLGTYVTILCNWLILWQNALYLYLGRSRMCLILQETRFQVQMLKLYKSIQDSSVKGAIYSNSTASIHQALKSCSSPWLDSSSTDRVSIEIYEIQIFCSVFHPIHDYMFELSFLTTLDIKNDYFKGRQRWHKLHKCWAKFVQANCDQR